MKKQLLMNQGNGIWTILILFSVLLVSSCSEDEIKPDVPEEPAVGVELPSSFHAEWKNNEGEIIFAISSSQVKYEGSNHAYKPVDVTETEGIYLIDLSDIKFYMSEGANENELFIGTSTTLSIYYKEVEIVDPIDPVDPLNLPDNFNGHWYKEDGYTSSSYFVADDHIKTAGTKFFYTETDVTEAGGIYTVSGTSENNEIYIFKIEAFGTKLKIERNGEGFKTYWDTPAIELPSSIFTVWYNYNGSLTYIIDYNQGNPYYKIANVRYSFGARNVELLDDEVYKINGESSSNVVKSLYLSVRNSDELFISESQNSDDFGLYWNKKDIVPNIDDFFFRKWFKVGAESFTHRIFVNNSGKNIVRDRSDGTVIDYVFHPTKGDVKKLGTDRFQIEANSTDGAAKTFFIKKNGTDDNSINIAVESESSYTAFYHVTGRNIERAEHSNGFFKVISGTTWGEYNDSGQLLWEVEEIGRSNWEVRLEKWSGGDQVVISMHQKWIFYVPEGTTQKQALYELTGYAIEP